MRENAVREQVQQGFITVEHIGGKHNLADPFTKEEKATIIFLPVEIYYSHHLSLTASGTCTKQPTVTIIPTPRTNTMTKVTM
jgi:hypothetical protein